MLCVKKIKGVALFLASMAISYSLLLNPGSAVASFIPYIGITLVTLSLLFFVSGVVNLIIGLRGNRWNAIWFTPYFLYTGLIWLWYANAGYKASSVHIPAMFTLLTVYLMLEIVEQFRETNSANRQRSNPSGRSVGDYGRDGSGVSGADAIRSVSSEEE